MGIINCQISAGFYEEPFVAEKEILEISIRGRDKPYFQGVKRSPLAFSLTFAFVNYYDEQKIREVARWLDQDMYKPFYTTINPERIYYCMLHSESQLLHNGLRQGYIQLQMRCSDPYTYSPIYIDKPYEWNESPLKFEESEFTQQGTLDQLVVDSNGQLQLDFNQTKWINISPNKKWNSL